MLERAAVDRIQRDRGGGGQRSGQVAGADRAPLAQQHGPLDHVLKLADVARPAVGLEGGNRVVGEALDRLARLVNHAVQEVPGQERDVGNPLAQRRQLDVDHVDPVEEVLAESTLGDQLGQVIVGGQDHPGVDGEGLVAADLLELEVLEDAEQLDLHRGTGGADLVQENRAAVGLLELAHLLADRPGERPGHVPKQLALQQRLRQRPAGHLDKRLVPPGAAAMDRPGDERLAGAALAGNQHGGLGVGHALDHVVDPQHAVVVADDVLQAETHVELGLEVAVLFQDLALVESPLDGQLQLFVDQRLGEEIEGPRADRLDRRLDRPVAGNQDHGRGGMVPAAMGEDVEAVAVAQADVGQDHVVGLAGEGREGFGPAGGGIDLIALLAEPFGHRGQDVPVVIDQ